MFGQIRSNREIYVGHYNDDSEQNGTERQGSSLTLQCSFPFQAEHDPPQFFSGPDKLAKVPDESQD